MKPRYVYLAFSCVFFDLLALLCLYIYSFFFVSPTHKAVLDTWLFWWRLFVMYLWPSLSHIQCKETEYQRKLQFCKCVFQMLQKHSIRPHNFTFNFNSFSKMNLFTCLSGKSWWQWKRIVETELILSSRITFTILLCVLIIMFLDFIKLNIQINEQELNCDFFTLSQAFFDEFNYDEILDKVDSIWETFL